MHPPFNRTIANKDELPSVLDHCWMQLDSMKLRSNSGQFWNAWKGRATQSYARKRSSPFGATQKKAEAEKCWGILEWRSLWAPLHWNQHPKGRQNLCLQKLKKKLYLIDPWEESPSKHKHANTLNNEHTCKKLTSPITQKSYTVKTSHTQPLHHLTNKGI